MKMAGGKKNKSNIPQKSSILLCFSHLRWDFVHQRPQHILTHASKQQQLIYFEEPVYEEIRYPSMRVNDPSAMITIVTPVLPAGISATKADAIQRTMVDEILAETLHDRLIAWYYTPMALRFSDHLASDVCVYDCMDELSAFKNAPSELKQLEKLLFADAQILSSQEGKASMKQNAICIHVDLCLPQQHRRRAFPQGQRAPRRSSRPGRIPHPRVGFFGVIDERLDVELVAQVVCGRCPKCISSCSAQSSRSTRQALPRAIICTGLGANPTTSCHAIWRTGMPAGCHSR